MIDFNERKREMILANGWQLFKDNILEYDFNSLEDKQCYLQECLEAAKYYVENASKELIKLMPEINEPIKKGITRNPKEHNRRTKPKVGKRKRQDVRFLRFPNERD